MSTNERLPWCAGRFYPGDPEALARDVDALLDGPERGPAVAVMAPHAGYVYSGEVAARTFAGVAVPRHVVLIGPKHTWDGAPAALSAAKAWRLPTGLVPVDAELVERLRRALPVLVEDDRAHAREHCLEVQLPFLRARQPDLRVVPLVLAGGLDERTCRAFGQRLAEVVAGFPEPVLLVASSDMHHQGRDDLPPGERTEDVVRARTALALERLDAFDPDGLVRTCRERDVTMCGVAPAAIVMEAARALGATRSEQVAVTDSHAARGGRGTSDYTVGYAGYWWSAVGSGNA